MTVGTHDAVHQSADFALTDGSGRVLSIPSTKQVMIVYPDWHGIVTFAGMGKFGPPDTDLSDWLADQFVGKATCDFGSALETIRRSGDQLLGRLKYSDAHTFTVAAIANGKSMVAAISNFEDLDGGPAAVEPSLHVSVAGAEG